MISFLSHNASYKYMQARFVVFLFVALGCTDVVAQEAAAIYVGPFDVTPTLNLNVENNDNVFSESAGNETSATLAQVIPAITAVADDGVVRYSLAYQLENGRYSGVDNNDYTDHDLVAKMDWHLDIRHLIEFGAAESRGHDERSTDSLSGLNATEVDKTKGREFSVNYTFGSEGARGRLILGFKKNSLRYLTNQQFTNVLESDTETVNARFLVGLGASSRALIEILDTENSFRANAVDDRQDRRYLVGVEWEVSDLVKGNVRLGRSTSDLVNAAGGSSSSVGEASITWSPVQHSIFTLSANKGAQNTENNIGSFIERSNVSLGWDYQINDSLTASVSMGAQRDNFVNTDRRDTLNDTQLQLKYAFRRWLDIGMGLTRTDRVSTVSSFDYDNSKVVLSVNASL
jgi:hypothetical protein